MEILNAVITGVAAYVPDYVLTNEELSTLVDTNDEWIMSRVGIKERRILKGEATGSSDLGYLAVNELLKKTSTKPEEIDLVICATSNPDYRFPSTASIIAEKSGIKHAFAYDIQAACSGFLYSLQAGAAYIKSGLYKKIIVLAAEKMSSMTNYTDRSTCPLFGDGAGAVLLEPTTENLGVMDAVLKTNGIGLNSLIMKAGGSVYPATHETVDNGDHYIYQDGRVVFKAAVSDMSDVSLEIMKRNNLTMETIDWLVPHQANNRIIEAIAHRMGIPHDKVMVNIQKYGNTSAATVPICLNEWESKLKKGDNLVLCTFGAGFSWGAIYLKWAYDSQH